MSQQASQNIILLVVAIILFCVVGLRGFAEWNTTQQASPMSNQTSLYQMSGYDPSSQLTDPGGMQNGFTNTQLQIKLPK